MGAVTYLETPNGFNPWLYANGNPLSFTDPSGECGRLAPGTRALMIKLGYDPDAPCTETKPNSVFIPEAKARRVESDLMQTSVESPERQALFRLYTAYSLQSYNAEARNWAHRNIGLPLAAGGVALAMTPLIAGVTTLSLVTKLAPVVGMSTLALSQTSGQLTAPVVYGPAVDAAECAMGNGGTADRTGACIRTATEVVTAGISNAPRIYRGVGNYLHSVGDAAAEGVEVGLRQGAERAEHVGMRSFYNKEVPSTRINPRAQGRNCVYCVSAHILEVRDGRLVTADELALTDGVEDGFVGVTTNIDLRTAIGKIAALTGSKLRHFKMGFDGAPDGHYVVFAGSGYSAGEPVFEHVLYGQRVDDELRFFDPQYGMWLSPEELHNAFGNLKAYHVVRDGAQ